MKNMTGISVPLSELSLATSSLEFETMFAVEIEGVWYKIKHTHKWLHDPAQKRLEPGLSLEEIGRRLESYGTQHRFEMEKSENPNKPLPLEVRQFIEKHLKDGSTKAELIVHGGEAAVPARGKKKGWVTD